jgi:hypothetical protein
MTSISVKTDFYPPLLFFFFRQRQFFTLDLFVEVLELLFDVITFLLLLLEVVQGQAELASFL